jgi:hypothetical protein
MKKTVIIQFDIDGYHFYKSAPKVVDFLKNRHRHIFTIKCGYKVDNLNREKEIFIQRNIIKKYLIDTYGQPCEFENMSCEMIAEKIIEYEKNNEMIWCEVWEENTGGAKIEI